MIRRIAPMLALAVFATPSFAAEAATAEKVCASKQCASKACAGAACASKGCPIEAAMAKLPELTYLVGKEETCCSASAAKLAKERKVAIKYVLAKKTFDNQAKATVALADATEKFVNEFAKPCKCDVSGKITVAGKELCCDVMAGERVKLVKKAMKKVEMTFLVGDQECACPDKAATLAKETGKEKVFVIAGEKTCCSVDARLKLARAKYRAAVEMLAKVDAPAKDQEVKVSLQ